MQLAAGKTRLRRMIATPDSSTALKAIEEEHALVSTMLPEDLAELWDWCCTCTRDRLLRVLALVTACAVNATRSKPNSVDSARCAHGMQLAEALGLDMRVWFTPGAENYFGQINRAGILAAIDEAKRTHAPALDKLKKGELAARAEDLVANTGWLPEPLRPVTKDAAA